MDGGNPDILARARALIPALEAASPRIEAARRIVPDVLDALHAEKLFRMLLPRSLDGMELPLDQVAAVIEAIAMGDASTAWCLGQAMGCSMSAGYLDEDARRAVFGDPRSVLAWGQPKTLDMKREDGGWRVTGEWTFSSGCRHASWMGALCMLPRPDGARDPRIILFPAATARFTDVWHVIGLRGTGTDCYAISDQFIPDAYSFVRENPADRKLPGAIYKVPISFCYAAVFGAVALGIARSMLDSLIDLARDKVATGRSAALSQQGMVQSQVGQMEARLRAARAYLMQAAREAWEDAGRREVIIGTEQRLSLRLAASHASLVGREVTELVYNLAGATAVFEGNPFERRFRDAHAVSQQIQAHMVHFETVGRVLMGVQPDLALM